MATAACAAGKPIVVVFQPMEAKTDTIRIQCRTRGPGGARLKAFMVEKV
jgi:hypothetical protein